MTPFCTFSLNFTFGSLAKCKQYRPSKYAILRTCLFNKIRPVVEKIRNAKKSNRDIPDVWSLDFERRKKTFAQREVYNKKEVANEEKIA